VYFGPALPVCTDTITGAADLCGGYGNCGYDDGNFPFFHYLYGATMHGAFKAGTDSCAFFLSFLYYFFSSFLLFTFFFFFFLELC
jgi:hypothetical protein